MNTNDQVLSISGGNVTHYGLQVTMAAPVLAYARQQGGDIEAGFYELVRLRFGDEVQASAHLCSYKPRYQKPVTERLLFNVLSQWGAA